MTTATPVVLTFDATVAAPTGAAGEYVNVAEVTASDQFDSDSTPDNDDGDQSEDDEDNASVVPQSADLSLTKTISAASPNVGDVVTFTITVTNDGPDAATGVSVEDVVPNGYAMVGNITSGGTLVGSSITWSGLSIASGDSVVLTFEATVQAPPADFVNVAEVTASDQFDPDSTPDNDDGDQSEDDEDNASSVPQVADLELAKTVSNPTANVGDTVTFTVTVTNDGPDAATNVAVEDVVPTGYSGVSNVSGGATVIGSTIRWSGLSIASGGSVALTFDAVVEAPPADFVNVAEVTASDQFDSDSTPGNDDGDQSEDDEDNAAVAPLVADLSLAKTVDDATPVVGDTVTFTITVTNGGPADATGVSVEDVAPAGYSAISNVSGGGTVAGSTITWSGLTVTTAAPLVLTFDATVEPPTGAADEYLNVAEVAASDQFDPDSTPGNDDGDQSEDDEDSAVVSPGVIGVAKVVSAVVNNGDGTYTVTYLLTLENLGGVTLSNLIVDDDVVTQFAGISPTGFVATDGTLGANAGWDGTAGSNILAGGQSLDPGESGTVQVGFTVTPGPDVGPHDNTATVVGSTPSGGTVSDVSQDGVDPDPDGNGDPSDNNDPTPVSFDEAPSIGVAKDVTAGPTSNGDGSFDVTYTVLVENTGDVVLSGVQVTDDVAATFAAAVSWSLVSVSSGSVHRVRVI